MDNSNKLKIYFSEKIDAITSFNSIKLKKEIKEYLDESNTPFKIAHAYILPLSLTNKSFLLISPSSSGRSSASMIGLLNNIEFSNINLQAIVLSPSKIQAEEYASDLEKLSANANINIIKILSGLKYNNSACQIAVATCGSLFRYIEYFNKNYKKHLKYVVLDIAYKFFREQVKAETIQILNRLNGPGVSFWLLSPLDDKNIKENFSNIVKNPVIIEIRDNRVFYDLTFYSCVKKDLSKRDEFILSLCYYTGNQVIIYSKSYEDLEHVEKMLENISVAYLSNDFTVTHQRAVLEDFKNEVFKVLICESKHSLVRKIETKAKVDVINLDIPPRNDILVARLKRFNYKPEDVIWIVVTEEKYPEIQIIAGKYSLNIIEYPNDD